MSSGRTRLAVLAALLGLFVPARSWASTGYPAEIQSQLQLSYTPACSICHAGGDTDAGTGASTAFGSTMVEFGLMGGNNLTSVDNALAGLVGTNSPYITDLKDGADPNGGGAIPPVTYGCFQGTGEGPTAGPAALFSLCLALLVLFRPRARALK
jgi:hypothetical protein